MRVNLQSSHQTSLKKYQLGKIKPFFEDPNPGNIKKGFFFIYIYLFIHFLKYIFTVAIFYLFLLTNCSPFRLRYADVKNGEMDGVF